MSTCYWIILFLRFLKIPFNYHYKTFNQLYALYVKYHNQKINYKLPSAPELITLSGYKSKDKINSLISKKVIKTVPQFSENQQTNYFPLKQNQKRYQLHTISLHGSYLIDLMFKNRKYCYLIAININTRKLYVEPTNIIIDDDLSEQHDEDSKFMREAFAEQIFENKIINKMKLSELY